MAAVNLSVQFGQRVRELREAAGISQEAFANKHGFARSYMSKIERGLANVALDAVQRLANGLGVEPKALFESATSPAGSKRTKKTRIMVPFAADGTCFNPTLRQPRVGTFVVGPKNARKRLNSFDDALAVLRDMGLKACWERPDGNGGRGIVTVVAWKPLPSKYAVLLSKSDD